VFVMFGNKRDRFAESGEDQVVIFRLLLEIRTRFVPKFAALEQPRVIAFF